MNEQNQKTVIMNIRGSLKGAENDEGRGKRRRRGGGGKTLIESRITMLYTACDSVSQLPVLSMYVCFA